MKPWDPPEERLYGVVDDLLDDWQASYRPVFEGVRVIGHRWSPHSNEIRDFLGRNFVPHLWLNVETDETAKKLLATTGAAAESLPIVVFADGSFLAKPPTAEVALKLGSRPKRNFPSTIWWSLGLVQRGWRRLCMGPRMACIPCSSNERRPEDRRAGVPASRITSAFRRG